MSLQSKTIKKSIHYQLKHYLKKNGPLYKYRSGFRANFFTNSCLAEQTNFVLTNMDKGVHTGTILTDFKEAFDIHTSSQTSF